MNATRIFNRLRSRPKSSPSRRSLPSTNRREIADLEVATCSSAEGDCAARLP